MRGSKGVRRGCATVPTFEMVATFKTVAIRDKERERERDREIERERERFGRFAPGLLRVLLNRAPYIGYLFFFVFFRFSVNFLVIYL